MTESANSENSNDIAATRATVAQRVESGYACTHQRRTLEGGEFLRDKGKRLSWRKHVLGVAAIERNSRGEQVHRAREKLAAPAMIAVTAVAGVPSHTHALAGSPRLDTFAHRVDDADHFVSGYTRILNTWPKSFFD
jgi:hypothetical protein